MTSAEAELGGGVGMISSGVRPLDTTTTDAELLSGPTDPKQQLASQLASLVFVHDGAAAGWLACCRSVSGAEGVGFEPTSLAPSGFQVRFRAFYTVPLRSAMLNLRGSHCPHFQFYSALSHRVGVSVGVKWVSASRCVPRCSTRTRANKRTDKRTEARRTSRFT
jgi:hypothetical protein